MSQKALQSLPPSFAAGLWDRDVHVELSPLDLQAVGAQDEERARLGAKELRIGVVRDLPEQVALAGEQSRLGQWAVLDDGSHVWRLTLRAAGASGLRVHLAGLKLPDACEVRVFDTEDPSQVRGPYTAAGLHGRQAFWTGAVFAPCVTVECFAPRGIALSEIALTADRVTQLYRDPDRAAKEGSCHNDVTCFPAWVASANGVAGIGVYYADDYIFCTGCLMNDLEESTWVDYFITANHCVANQAEAEETEFYWFFQTASCNGPAPSVTAVRQTDGGADYLAGQTRATGNDFSLLRLRSASPDGATYAGWSTTAPSAAEQLACIHHPDGAYKRISFGTLDDSDADYWYVNFTDGATEAGSSGAPLFNASGEFIGQLWGGLSACESGGGIDLYGRFDVTYPSVAPWLAGSGVAPVTAGTYTGLFYRDVAYGGGGSPTAVCGTFTLTVSRSGRLTAKAVLQQRTLSFRASDWQGVDASGASYVTMMSAGGERVELLADGIGASGWLSGGSLGGSAYWMEGSYHVFGDRADLAAQADLAAVRGYYTVALPAADAVARGAANVKPGGSGYLALTVGNGGSVKIAGVLADGTRVAQSSKLILFGDYGTEVCVPLFRPLYMKRGWVSGLLWIDPASRTVVTDWDNDWYVRWEKPGSGPDGFEALLMACGGYYGASAPLAAHYRLSAEANAVRYFASGVSAEPRQEALPLWLGVDVLGQRLIPAKGVKPVLANGAYVYSGENSALTTLRFSAYTGIYKGTFNLYYDYALNGRLTHKAVKAAYAGILTQTRDPLFADWPEGQGSCLVPDNDPALKSYRLKRSFWMDLFASP